MLDHITLVTKKFKNIEATKDNFQKTKLKEEKKPHLRVRMLNLLIVAR